MSAIKKKNPDNVAVRLVQAKLGTKDDIVDLVKEKTDFENKLIIKKLI